MTFCGPPSLGWGHAVFYARDQNNTRMPIERKKLRLITNDNTGEEACATTRKTL
jgi:hypothetical protein